MKVNNLIKKAAGGGTIFTHEDKNYLFYNNTLVLLPEQYVVTGARVGSMPKWMSEALWGDESVEVNLSDAFLPRPDSKGSEIIRVFGCDSVHISQEQFALIERSDRTFYAAYTVIKEDGAIKKVDVLLITDEYGDEAEFKGLIIGKEKE